MLLPSVDDLDLDPGVPHHVALVAITGSAPVIYVDGRVRQIDEA